MLCSDHCLCSGRVPDSDGELLQASRDLLRRQDLVLLSSDELWWYRGSGFFLRRRRNFLHRRGVTVSSRSRDTTTARRS